jgi:nitrogen-specific signal transduction histidine kinase
VDAPSYHSPLSHFDATDMLETLGLPVLVLDRECCVVFVNQAARRLTGLAPRQMQGQPLDLLFADGRGLRASLSRLLATGTRAQPLRLAVRQLARPERALVLKAQVLDDEATGPHLLVQLGRMRERKRRPVLQLMPGIDVTIDMPAPLVAEPRTQLEYA